MWPYNNSHNHYHTIKSYNLTHLNRTYTSTTPNLREYTIETDFPLNFNVWLWRVFWDQTSKYRMIVVKWHGVQRTIQTTAMCWIGLFHHAAWVTTFMCWMWLWITVLTMYTYMYTHLLKSAIDMSCKFSKVPKPLLPFFVFNSYIGIV